ncbi:MAG TPA: alpha/beta fold hydrolase [Gammaproteobacteria bacterium]|nr:alpha/beta fold hydrolase [Gammaproteobacteria bacterium]
MNLAEYPFAGQYHTVNGFRMHYLDEGPRNGEILLMLHGNPSWSYLFRKPVLAFRARYRCIVPDHIGMGLSEKPAATVYPYTLARRIDDLDALIQTLLPDKPLTLILHDWGGMIGMGYALRYPALIERLVVMNTAAFHLPDDIPLPWQLRLARLPGIGPLLIRGANAFCRGAITYGVARGPAPPEVRATFLAPYTSWRERVAVMRFVEDIPLGPGDLSYGTVGAIEQGLSRFRDLPMLFCWGMRDFIFDGRFLAEWIKRFPEAETLRLEDAGHYLLEDAADEVIAAIDAFLQRHP